MPMLVRSKEAHVTHSALGLPVDEVTRPELIDFGGKVLRAENVRQATRGATSKRNGFAALANTHADGSSPTVANKIFSDGSALARVADGQVETYSAATGRWKQLGRVPEVTQRLFDVPTIALGSTLGGQVSDLCYCNGYFASAWLAPSGAPTYATVVAITDATTGATVRAPELLGAVSAANSRPLLACYSVYIIAFWAVGGGSITAMYLDTTSATTIATGWVALGGATIITDAFNFLADGWTYAVQSLTDRVAFFYVNNAGGASQATCKTINISGVIQTQTVNTAGVQPTRVAVCGSSSDTLWLTWCEATLIRAQGLTPGTLSSTLATKATVMTMLGGCAWLGIAQSATAGAARVIANDTTGTQLRMRNIVTSGGAAAGSGTEVRVPQANATQRPWQYSGRFYVTVTADTTQKTVAVVDWTDSVTYLRPVSLSAPGLVAINLGTTGFCNAQSTAVVGPVASKVYLLAQVTKSGAADASQLVELDYGSTARWQSASFGNSTYLSGGVLSSFDSVRAAEVSFLFRPITPTTGTSSTGISAATGWRYVCVYEEVDSDGNWSISGLSNPSASTGVVANKTVTITTSPLSITARLNSLPVGAVGVRVAFYRTLDGGVAPYYRLGTSANDTTALTVTFADSTPDATLAANAVLYSQPGVLGTAQDRRPPPGLGIIVSYNGMLVGASGSDLWFSGQNVSGEGAWFNPIFQVPIPGSGDITALAILDGALAVFKRREVYLISGDSPVDNGSSGGLGAPRRLAADVGCIDPRTTCTTAQGIFFQSERGIEVLTRAQTVEWIGEPFDVTVGLFPVCTSITVEPFDNVVLVELSATEAGGVVTGTGCTLVYDLSLKFWVSKDIRTTGVSLGVASQSAANVWTGTAWRYAWLATTGVVYYETPGASLDVGVWVTSLVETASAKHGLQQEQRIWGGVVLFEHTGAAGLKVEFGYDYAAYSSANDKVWTEANTLGQRQLPFAPLSRGQATRFRISDSAPLVLGTGQGLTLIGLSLDTAPKQGTSTGTPRLDPALRR